MELHLHLHFEMAAPRPREHAEAARPLLTLGQALGQQMQRMATARSLSTMRNYSTATRSLLAYLQGDVPLDSVTALTLGGYERWLRGRGLCQNTTSCYMRSLRALLTACDGRLGQLFGAVYTGKVSTEKRSVPTAVITRLQRLSLPAGSFLELARNVFLFSFYAMGMPFVDVARLRWSQMAADHFVYHRHKTGQRVRVALEPAMTAITNRYRRTGAVYVFPLLTSGSEREYHALLGRYNRALHRLERQARLGVRLTSYVVRHTWASTAYGHNVELPVISKALGHANTQTTLTYIREIDDQRLADANRRIISLL